MMPTVVVARFTVMQGLRLSRLRLHIADGHVPHMVCMLPALHATGIVQDERRAVHGLQRVTDDRRISDAVAQHLAHQLEENVDLNALVQLASQACMPPMPEGHPAVGFDQEHHVRLAVARDAAFSMYYSEYVPCPHALHQLFEKRLHAATAPPRGSGQQLVFWVKGFSIH